ncbi:MAG: 2-keto-4-pentenoate hydratase [Comamonas sp.]
MKKKLAALALAALGTAAAQAACLDDAQVAAMVAAYGAKQPAANPLALSDEDGRCTRAKFNAALQQAGRKPVGYKAGLTNPAVQKRFGTDHPVWGVLYDGMLLQSGAKVPAAFGARPLFEADMLVRVSSTAINQAATPAEVLEAIDRIVPFIELPDLVVAEPGKLNGAGVEAINVGARLGVMGEPIPVPRYRAERHALLDALQRMEVTLTDAGGARLGGGKGSDLMEQPLNAVLWLTGALAREGRALQVGDWVSLGSFSALLPPKAGLAVTLQFHGLPGAQPVQVSFE